MGDTTVAETIREITRYHLSHNKGLLIGQSLTAVGWVNGTVPDCEGIVELPMTDIAGAGIAVGVSLVGRRPIFVVRFQDFLILNGSPLIFYAAKVKELHGRTAPVFVRAIASEGLGPVHSGVLHSLFMHFPGFKVCAPMTPCEYQAIWDVYMESDSPMITSEFRGSYTNTDELENVLDDSADITLYPIAATRFEVGAAQKMLLSKGIRCNVIHILWLKPLDMSERVLEPLRKTKCGLVIDSGYEIAGAARSIAYELNDATGYPVKALGLADKTKCLCPPFKNSSPDAIKICEVVEGILKKP